MSTPTSTQPAVNPWLLSYIIGHQTATPRYQIDHYLLEVGYNPTHIEAGWQAFYYQTPASPPKPKAKLPKMLKTLVLGLLVLLSIEQYSLYFQLVEQVWEWPPFFTYPASLTPLLNANEVSELVSTIERADVIIENIPYTGLSAYEQVFMNDPQFPLIETMRSTVLQDKLLDLQSRPPGYLDYQLAVFHKFHPIPPIPRTGTPPKVLHVMRQYEYFRLGLGGERAEVCYKEFTSYPVRVKLALVRTSTGWKIVGKHTDALSDDGG